MSKIELRSELTLFDVTKLVVGAIIGAVKNGMQAS